MYLHVQVHSLYTLQSNQFVPVFQGMLVQEELGWCKLLLQLLLLLSHRRDKNSLPTSLVQTKYVLSTHLVHTQYILVCTQYILSTYSVQGYASCEVTLQSCN